MPKKKMSDQEQALFNLLADLSGHLETTSRHDERAVRSLQEALAQTLSDETITAIKNSSFSIEQSDLFFTDAIAEHEATRLKALAARTVKEAGKEKLRVFVRDVPVRSTQIAGSVPLWAGGAAVDKTLGPFLNKDGRKLWFDFYKIEVLVALYIAGQADPAILFDVSVRKKIINKTLPPVVNPAAKYKLVPDSVWINSRIFAANAPAGFFTPLRIKGGELALSVPPQIVNGKLTIAPTTVVTVKLDLNQPAVTDADPSSPYGQDARNEILNLPTHISFHFSGSASSIDAIADNPHWSVYGHLADFKWNKKGASTYDPVLNRVLLPFTCSRKTFAIRDCRSPFTTFAGEADIQWAAWALPCAQVDVTKPAPAAGIGGMAIGCAQGVTVQWTGLQGGDINLTKPYVLADVGRINVTDLSAGNLFCTQEYKLWKDDVNPFGSTIDLQYTNLFPFVFNTFANGNEALLALVNTNPLLDRPVTVTGQPFDIHSKKSVLVLAVNKAFKLIYLYDDNILFDNYDPGKPKETLPQPVAVALQNALFKVSPVNGCLLFGFLADDMVQVERGILFLTFGMYAYLPTLPDPYAANLNRLKYQFGGRAVIGNTVLTGQTIWLWLVCQIAWQPASPDTDTVDVSFHFAPLENQFQVSTPAGGPVQPVTQPTRAPFIRTDLSNHPFVRLFSVQAIDAPTQATEQSAQAAASAGDVKPMMFLPGLPDYQAIWDRQFSFLEGDVFALLDVSSNADQMGVSFAWFGDKRMAMLQTFAVVTNEAASAAPAEFPVQVKGLDVVARGYFVRAFTVPLISWEPILNLTAPEKPGDPPVPLNYYPDDGGPTKIMNNSAQFVPIAPIPVSDFLIQAYKTEPNNITAAYSTLPFGLRTLAFLYKTNKSQSQKPDLQPAQPSFADDLKGGIQFQLTAGSGFNSDEDNMFRGYTLQTNNVLDSSGQKTDASTLGYDVSVIFNGEFFEPVQATLDDQRGVPVTRMDVSGYGGSIISNWVNTKAQFASTSQAKFDVFVGRCSHEVIQVKSILYPWGIRVVRTITLFRVGSGYVYRYDSGWRAESDGKFDFTFQYHTNPSDPNDTPKTAMPYSIHPGVVQGLFNVQNIRSAVKDVAPFLFTMDITGFYQVDPATNRIEPYVNAPTPVDVNLQSVYFDADLQVENVVQGQSGGLVPGKKILGFVQLAPRGIPLTPQGFQALLARQFGSIGGPIDCIVDIGKNGQKMRINWVDVNNSTDATNTKPVFAAAIRGNVILPKDGSWSMVTHAQATGDVTPLPDAVTVPLIRIGELAADLTYPDTDLLRIANPTELLRAPMNDTVNFGFLQSTNTQKVLFLTPSFAKQLTDTVPGKLLSKTPPLFADAYRIISSKGIFPNIGDALSNFGDAIALTKDFVKNPLTDGGTQVLELMGINTPDGVTRLQQDGYKLLNAAKNFDLPSTAWYLINEDYLKVYVEYKADTQNRDGSTQARTGSLNYDVDSFASSVAERWKSRLNNLAMVVDLGPFSRLMLVKGNFNANDGAEASYEGDASDADFPSPQLSFSKDLQPVIDILQILEDLQGENYADAIKKGLKIAMSNDADSWEYKFEASKEIPVVKFPVPDAVYNDPNTPFKLEASLKVSMYFNAALSTAAIGDPKKLLPTAGASLDFYGRLSVMCVSLSVATIYAVGQVNLGIAADTKVGPSLTMKFGFGAQIVVGLPVVGNVSVLYMAGVEIYADSTKLNVSAFLLFQGQAELLGGLVGVTITIEAKGTISRSSDRTDCAAQVTFGLDISIFLVIDISFSTSWQEQRQIA